VYVFRPQVAIKNELTQTLMTACIESDADLSGHFSDEEIMFLWIRVKNVPGIVVNQALLMKSVQDSDRTLASVLKLLDHLDGDTLTDQGRVFQFDQAHLQPR
jgi:hypothetical protein